MAPGQDDINTRQPSYFKMFFSMGPYKFGPSMFLNIFSKQEQQS